MKKWLLSIIVSFLLITTPSFAESLSVTNTQYNTATHTLSGMTAPNATITLNGVAGNVLSDGDGQFTINVPETFKHAELFITDPEGNQKTTVIPLDSPNNTNIEETSHNTSNIEQTNSNNTNTKANDIKDKESQESSTQTHSDKKEVTTSSKDVIESNASLSKISDIKSSSTSDNHDENIISSNTSIDTSQDNTKVTEHLQTKQLNKQNKSTVNSEQENSSNRAVSQKHNNPQLPTWAWPALFIIFILVIFAYFLKRHR